MIRLMLKLKLTLKVTSMLTLTQLSAMRQQYAGQNNGRDAWLADALRRS